MNSLTVRTRQVRGVVVVDLEGEITLGDTNRHLHNAIHQLIKEGKRQIILNLANVKRIDSSGLGEIVAGFTTLSTNGGSLKLINMPTRVNDLMTITKLYTVFDVYNTEAEGIDSFDEEINPITQPLEGKLESQANANVSQFRRRAGGLL